MWKVEYKVYDRATNSYSVVRKFFNSKRDTLDYCEMLKSFNLNADITLEDMTPVDGSSYTHGEVVWIQKATIR